MTLQNAYERTNHENRSHQPEPLAGINTLITGGMGPGLFERLMQSGILPVVTMEEDPDAAVSAMLGNRLERLPVPRGGHCHERGHFSHGAR